MLTQMTCATQTLQSIFRNTAEWLFFPFSLEICLACRNALGRRYQVLTGRRELPVFSVIPLELRRGVVGNINA